MHNYDRDLYGNILKVCIAGYLRPEQNFDSLDALIAAIKKDISDAEGLLEDEEMQKLKFDDFFTQTNTKPRSDEPLQSNGSHL